MNDELFTMVEAQPATGGELIPTRPLMWSMTVSRFDPTTKAVSRTIVTRRSAEQIAASIVADGKRGYYIVKNSSTGACLKVVNVA